LSTVTTIEVVTNIEIVTRTGNLTILCPVRGRSRIKVY